MQDRRPFFEADHESHNVMVPLICDAMKTMKNEVVTNIVATPDGDHIDAHYTAVTETGIEKYYSAEFKNRTYRFSAFVNAAPTSTLSDGIFIKPGKVKSLMDRRFDEGKTRTSYYICNFTGDNNIVFWDIEKSHLTDCAPKYYDLYNVDKGQKEWQYNKGLLPKEADIVYHYEG